MKNYKGKIVFITIFILIIFLIYWLNDPNVNETKGYEIAKNRYETNKSEFNRVKEICDSILFKNSCFQYTLTYTIKGAFWQECDSSILNGLEQQNISFKDSIFLQLFMSHLNIETIKIRKEDISFVFADISVRFRHFKMEMMGDSVFYSINKIEE